MAHSNSDEIYEHRDTGVFEQSFHRSASFSEAKEAVNETCIDKVQIGNVSAPERIMFCIDGHFASQMNKDSSMMQNVFTLIKSFIAMKQAMAVKAAEFALLLIVNKNYRSITVNSDREIINALSAVKVLENVENEPFDFSDLFSYLAESLELPDDKFHNEDVPPPWIYHLVLLFCRHEFIPKLENPNPYYFVMDNALFTADVIYFARSDSKREKQILKALQCIFGSRNGKVFSADNFVEQKSSFSKCLTHPSMRALSS